MSVPRRMIFFDSEAQVTASITDEEVERAGDPSEPLPVIKEHYPYLICATFKCEHERRPGEYRVKKIQYHAENIPGVGRFPEGHDGFRAAFWRDAEAYCPPGQHLYMFAHNAKYDTLVTGAVHYLVREHGFTVDGFSDNNPFFHELTKVVRYERYTNKDGIEVERPIKKTIIILSSTNYYQQSLKSLGEAFGLPKLDFAHGQPFTLPEAITYCWRDVDILELAMMGFINFVRRERLGKFARTVAGQSFSAFKHRFLGGKTVWIHDDEEAIALERRAYAGGRTECFHIGEVSQELYYVDVNSMYPYVMKHFLYPVKLITRRVMCTVEHLRELIQNDYLVCADVRVNTERPVFHQKKERLIFPVGDFWTTLSTPELIYGLNNNLITEVGAVSIYEADNIHEAYVDYFYEERLKAKAAGDKVHDLLFKIFLNSMYGKWGQKHPPWEEIGKADPAIAKEERFYIRKENRVETHRTYGGKIWRRSPEQTDEESHDSFPAIAAHVTSAARMLLLQYIECAGWDTVYYCDTDSLFTTREGYERLKAAGYLHNKELGKLKLEDTGRLVLFGCKDYIFRARRAKIKVTSPEKIGQGGAARLPRLGFQNNNGADSGVNLAGFGSKEILKPRKWFHAHTNYTKIKGVSKSARRLPDTPDGKLCFAVNQWTGYAERFKIGGDFLGYYTKVIIKVLQREYNKGDVTEGGKVEPFRLDYERESREAYHTMLSEGANDLFVSDPVRFYVRALGRILMPLPGERYRGEYEQLPKYARVQFFARSGKPLDEWADEAGMNAAQLLDMLQLYPLRK